MNVLVACEESQRVCTAFRERGHNAFSCDIQPCSGGHPEWHIQGDVLKILNPHPIHVAKDDVRMGIEFYTNYGQDAHTIWGAWDMIIAHPPCTHLANSGAKHFAKKRADGRQYEGIEFFCQFLHAECDRIVVENPVGIISGDYIKEYFPELAERYALPVKPTQIIQPYEFGDPFKKTTCLWIVGDVKPLVPDNIVNPLLKEYISSKTGKKYVFSKDYGSGSVGAGARRSKTYPGIARAMAEQWG